MNEALVQTWPELGEYLASSSSADAAKMEEDAPGTSGTNGLMNGA